MRAQGGIRELNIYVMFMRSTNQEEQPRYNTLSGRNQAMAQGQGNEQGLITPNSEQENQSDDEIYIVTPARTPEDKKKKLSPSSYLFCCRLMTGVKIWVHAAV